MQVDEAAVRNTRSVDILVGGLDLPRVIEAMTNAGFVYAGAAGVNVFIDGPDGKPREGIRLIFAGKKVRPDYGTSAASMQGTEAGMQFRVVSLEALVRMNQESNRDKDRAHVRDLTSVGLIDKTGPDRFPDVLADRLRGILATPVG